MDCYQNIAVWPGLCWLLACVPHELILCELSLRRSFQPCGVNSPFVTELLCKREKHLVCFVDVFRQLCDFAENMRSQLRSLVVSPMQQFQQTVGHALRQARLFDEESEALDGAQAKYLSLPREAPLETRAYAQQDIDDKCASVALCLFDTRCALQHACAQQRLLLQRALGELLVSQARCRLSASQRCKQEVSPHAS
eukprot:5545441-Pleurochrysis_carterae.AAC.2